MLCSNGCEVDRRLCSSCEVRLKRAPFGLDIDRPTASLDSIFAAFDYGDIASELIKALKYKGRTRLAATLAESLAERLPRDLIPSDCVIVPVPAHPSNARTRGYNQSKLIATELARLTGCPMIDCLTRVGGGRPQSQLSRAERLQLPADEFRLAARPLRQADRDSLAVFPTNVAVCDDVTTTTCTLEACASAIRERHSVQTIHGLAFASASPPRHSAEISP